MTSSGAYTGFNEQKTQPSKLASMISFPVQFPRNRARMAIAVNKNADAIVAASGDAEANEERTVGSSPATNNIMLPIGSTRKADVTSSSATSPLANLAE